MTTRMPALYLGHGAPLLLDDALWTAELRAWSAALPRPKAILIVSAHWETAPLALSAAQPRGLVYDFSGFDPKYYRLRYDTPDATASRSRRRADAGHRAAAPARDPRAGPRRVHPTHGDVA